VCLQGTRCLYTLNTPDSHDVFSLDKLKKAADNLLPGQINDLPVKCEVSEECNHEYQDNQESNVSCILITKLNAEVLGF
jgi:hypothetical protein